MKGRNEEMGAKRCRKKKSIAMSQNVFNTQWETVKKRGNIEAQCECGKEKKWSNEGKQVLFGQSEGGENRCVATGRHA